MGCAQTAKDAQEHLIGTAPQYQHYILIEDDQKLWEMGIGGSAFQEKYYSRYENMDLIFSLINRQQKNFLRPILIAKDGVHTKHRVFLYSVSSNGYVGYSYDIENLSRIPALLVYHFSAFHIDLPQNVQELCSAIGQQFVKEQAFAPKPDNTLRVFVCNHSQYDKCCSAGRVIYNELLNYNAVDTWRCSHLGGHRFASTLVTFPDGRYYGFMEKDTVPELLKSMAANKPLLQKYRGSGLLNDKMQVAEKYAWESSEDNLISVSVKVHEDKNKLIIVKYLNDNTQEKLVLSLELKTSEQKRFSSCSDLKEPEKENSWSYFAIINVEKEI